MNDAATSASEPGADLFARFEAMNDDDFAAAWPATPESERSALPASSRQACLHRYARVGPASRSRFIGEKNGAPARVNGEERQARVAPHGEDKGPEMWPEPLDFEALSEREPKPPEFNVQNLVPCGYATLLAGHGGIGKSAIGLHLQVCIALGLDFFGVPVKRRRVMYLSCEDREGVLHWRLNRICAHLGMDMARLRGWLELLDLVGKNTVLWERDPRTGYSVTSAFMTLAERVKRHSTEVLVIDGISDTFGGNEASRTEVKQYVNALLSLTPAEHGSLILIGHVNRPTAANPTTSEGYSGSTGWHNAVRARLYLYPETRQGEDGERAQRTGDLLLELQKSNLGPMEASMRFAWDEAGNLFVGRSIGAATAADRAHRDRVERDGILTALRASTAAGVHVPTATTGQRTAYHVLSARQEFPDSLRDGTSGKRRFWRQIELLRQMGEVREESIRRKNRHATAVLVAVREGAR